MRKIKLASVLCVIVLLLVGCSSHTSLGERAIVKAIYLNEAQGSVQAVLVIMSCAPQANTADVQNKMNFYTGTGNSIATAIFDAEKQQNKRPFYAQNRLLLLGPDTLKSGVSSYLSYFGGEEVSRTNLSVFVVPLSADEFANCNEAMETVIQEGERMADEPLNTGNRTKGVYEMRYTPQGQFFGYLPVLDINPDSSAAAQVTQLMLFQAGKPSCLIQNTKMQLALLLSQKTNCLTTHLQLEGVETTFQTQRLWVQREVKGKGRALHLEITLRGKIESVSQNGKMLQGEELKQAIRQYNGYLQQSLYTLYEYGFAVGNDIFNDTWWFMQKQASDVETLKSSGEFYSPQRISFVSKIKKA